jgi:hypothetical protein
MARFPALARRYTELATVRSSHRRAPDEPSLITRRVTGLCVA